MLCQQRRGHGNDPHEQIAQGLALEGAPPREALEGNDAEGPEIGPEVDGLRALGLLGAHVKRRAHERPRAGLTALRKAGGFRDTEIEDLHDFPIIVAHQKQVIGLEIAMDDARRVGACQAPRGLSDDEERLLRGEAAHAQQPLREVLSLQELHREVGNALPHSVVHDLHDVGAAQLCGSHGLAREAGPNLAVVRGLLENELHRACNLQLDVVRQPDRAHPTPPQLASQPKAIRDEQALAQLHGGRQPSPDPSVLLPEKRPPGSSSERVERPARAWYRHSAHRGAKVADRASPSG
jgi:hypothetical protein